MNWTILPRYLSIVILCNCIRIICSQSNIDQEDQRQQIGCQQRLTLGRDYDGEANITFEGIPCQRWSDTQPHNHDFTDVGDHNFCRNPDGVDSEVWCFTTDPKVKYQTCSVPFCPPSEEETRRIGCQQQSTVGRDYVGEANTTVDGIPCQRWSDTQPHDHSFTHVGDHNFCRNPSGASESQVWCYTTDPKPPLPK